MNFSSISPQFKGLLITTLGVVAFTPDALLIRMAELDHASLLFWRGVSFFLAMMVFLVLLYKGNTVKEFKQIRRLGLCTGLFMGCASSCFVVSLYYTSAANALVIMSASPMFAALYSRLFLKERVPLYTLVTMVFVVLCTGFIVGDTSGNNSLIGNLIATMAAASMGGSFTLMRKGRDRNMVPVTAISGLVLIAVGAILAPNLTLSIEQVLVVALMGSLVVIGFAMISIGTRYITSPEASLLMPIETVFGTWLVWIILGETASITAMLSGLLIICALSIHSFISIQRTKKI